MPAKSIKEFIDYVKRNPGRLSYGSAGQGSLTHLTMELFKLEIGAFMLHIPYRGIAPAINDVLGGQTQAMFPGLAAALPHLRGSVLDYGCGEALFAGRVAERCGALYLSDAAPSVREKLAARHAGDPKIAVLTPEDVAKLDAATPRKRGKK